MLHDRKHIASIDARRLHATCYFLALYLFLCAAPVPLFAGTEDVKTHEKNVAAMEKREAAVLNELNDIDYALNVKKKEVAALKSAAADIDARIALNTERSMDLAEMLDEKKNYAAKRLVALYKLNQLGRLHYLATADSMYQFFYRRTLLEKVLEQDQKLLKDLTDATLDLERISTNLKSQKQKKHALQNDLTRQINNMLAAKEKRAELLNKIRNEKSLELAAIQSLEHSAKALNEKINRLQVDVEPTEEDQVAHAKIFSDLKGLLKMPVKGKITHFFGTYTDTRFNLINFRSGINIKADRGEPVHAVFGGTTLYASWFKGYGNMIIIDHGDHYYTVYAHAEELFKKKGDPVKAGEVIATVGDSGSMSGPGLHFEVRYHGKPVDPMQWIRKS